MIVTGEASGDLHGANLVRALQSMRNSLYFYGMGGPELAGQGVEIIFDAAKVSVVGVLEVFAHLADIFRAQRALRRRMEADPPAVLILIDLPDFNLLLAKKAQRLGIPVFYYISPQVWAWRSGRVKTLRDRVDKIGVILPFEEDFFKQRGVTAEYVGHPLLDSVRVTVSSQEFRSKHDLPDNCKCIGLLPGSRRREISTLLPIFFEAGRRLQDESSHPLVFFIPLASTVAAEDLEAAGLSAYQATLDIRVIHNDRYNMMAACDAVVAASGTVTLELALLEVPMVVVYRLSSFTYRLGRLLIKLKYFSLVNLIAGYEAVPELLQDQVTPAAISSAINSLLNDDARRSKMVQALQEVKVQLGEKGASQRAARAVLGMIDSND